ncbi:tandem-95 repeat protein [Aurantivibrio infirmus]
MTVTAVNDAPVATDDAITATEDTVFTSTIDLDANDTDLDGDALSVVAGTFATNAGGSITIASDGSYTYTPALNYNGADFVDYTVTDGTLSDVGRLNITVNAVNDAPVANDDAITATEDTVFTSIIDLDANDLDVDGDALSVVAGTFATNAGGSITIAADGSYTYTPALNYNGVDFVDYTVTDGTLTDVGRLNITVNAVNDAPVLDLDANDSTAAGSDFATAFTEGGSPAFVADVDVSITDVDGGTINSATIVVQSVEAGDLLTVGTLPSGITASAYNPATGTITLSGNATLANYQTAIRAIQFTNDGSSSTSSRTVDVTVSDGTNVSNVASTTIAITTLPTVSVTDVSIQEPTSGTTTLTFTVSVDEILGSDLNFNFSTSDISALAGSDYVAQTSVGTITAGQSFVTIDVVINSDTNNFEGDETFNLNLTGFDQPVNFPSSAHTISGGIQAIGTIGANNGAPVATDDSFITQPDTVLVTGNVLANDQLVDNAVINSFDATSVGGGTVVNNGDGTFTYTPLGGFSGTDSFTYTLIDDDGEMSTATVTVEVTAAVVTPPIVAGVPDSSFTENGTPISLLAGTSLTDADSTTLSSVVVEINGYIGSQDVLDFLTSGTSVNASINAVGNTWTLTLTGGVDINEYLAVLNTLTYENTSENPSTAARTINVTAYDQQFNNVFDSDSGSITVVAVNDAPVVTDNDVFTAETTNDNPLGIIAPTDFDNDDATLIITVTGIPTTIGTVMMADGVTPVTNGQQLTIAELTSLVFDANAVQGTETLTYTVDDGTAVTIGTTTIDVGTTNPDFSTVYESGLTDGTQSGPAIVSGNLLTNDAIGTTAIDSVDFGASNFTAVGGVITVDTPLGLLTVYADNSTPGRNIGDYDYQLEVADGSGNDVTETFTYNFTNGTTFSDDLTITVVDDQPIANNLVEDIPESEEKIFNLVFTLDVSTSMNAQVGATGQSRLDLAKQSLVALANEYFNQSTQVSLTVLLFANGAHELGTYTTFSAAQAAINGVTDNTQTSYSNDVGTGNLTDSTSYVDALDLIDDVFAADLGAQNPADNVQNISYFLSDGTITADGSPIGNGFNSFVNNNSIDSYSVGIGTGLPSDLSDLDYIHNIDSLGSGNVDPALIVSNVALLESELLSTVPTAFGGNITFNGSIPNILFGADDGFVQSIILDLDSGTETFTFDGTTITAPGGIGSINGSQLTLSSSAPGDGFNFGTFTFDFSDGTYLFSAPNGTAPETFDFNYTVLDGDGDTASAMATINIVDDKPDARDDLDSYQAIGELEGNVINGLGTDGGPQFGTGFTPFANQGGGIDKIVDNAVVTEITYRNTIIDLDISTVLTPTTISADAAINNGTDFSSLDFSLSSASGVGFNGNGAGVSGGRAGSTIDDNDGGTPLTITFDQTTLTAGVDNLVLGINDFQSNNADQLTIRIYDLAGGLLGTEVVSAQNTGNFESVDLSAYTGVGSVDISYSGGGFDAQLSNVAYDANVVTVSPDPASGSSGTLSWVYSVDTDLDGNQINQAVITDSSDDTQLIFRSNGYYNYNPDTTVVDPSPVTINTTSAGNVAAGDFTLTTPASSVGFDTNGAIIVGGPSFGDGDRISEGEVMEINFDTVAMTNGVNDVSLTIGSYSNGEAVQIDVYDVSGGALVTGLIIDSGTIDLSAYENVGQVVITGPNAAAGNNGTATNVGLLAVTYTQAPVSSPAGTAPVVVDYTLTDTDGQTDTAQLAIYSIDNEIFGTTGADNIAGGASNDAIVGDDGDDILAGGAGHDNISGGAGLDLLVGGTGDDYLSGGDDADDLQGGVGSDHLAGDAGDDLLDGGAGDDIALGGDGDDQVFGGAGDDRIEGGDGDDALFGGAGNDQVDGGDGDDLIVGGTGDDVLLGGLGVDVFKWSFADGGAAGTPNVDTISDFNVTATSGGGDALDLRDLLVGETTGTLSDFMYFETQGSDTVVHISSDGGFSGGYDSGAEDQTIVIENVDLLNGFADQAALIQDLITNGKLITD